VFDTTGTVTVPTGIGRVEGWVGTHAMRTCNQRTPLETPEKGPVSVRPIPVTLWSHYRSVYGPGDFVTGARP